MRATDFRRMALGLAGAVEGAHMGHPDFRVNNRIFATLHHDPEFGMVSLTPDQQQQFMRAYPARVLLWLLVINLGVAFGAGLYEGRIVVSQWLISSPESGLHWDAEAARRDDTGLRFWVFVTTVPLTLLTAANLIAAWRAAEPVRRWWLAAGAAALADRVFTFAYFIPTMVGLMEAPDSSAAVATAVRWANLNYIRHAIVLTAWLAALKAFALVYQDRRPAKGRT